jgi:glycosyltransferase involved in cell wall biosynthesis
MIARCRDLLPRVEVEEFCIGLDARHFRPATPAQRKHWRTALRLPEETVVILSPRGWEPSYRQHDILGAFAAARAHLPQPAILLFVQAGRSQSYTASQAYFDQVRGQADELGVADQCRFLPAFPAATMSTLYNSADLVVSYRTPDTFPVTGLEVLACARPLLLPDLPTIADSVLARHARLVPPKSPADLAVALVETAVQPPAQAWLAAGRDAVLAGYDRLVVMPRIAAGYRRLAGWD